MCDPMTIAGVALSAGSSIANASAQRKVARARYDAMAAERIRQRGLDQEADALNVKSRDQYTDFESKQAEKSASLADYFTDQEVAEPSAEAALPTTASNITIAEEAKQRAKAKEFTDRSGAALGQLRSFGDLMGDFSRLQARNASEVGQIGGFKRGSSNILGWELEDASRAGDNLKRFGDLLNTGSSALVSAGLSGPSRMTTYGEYIGAVPPRLPDSYFPKAPSGSLLKLY